jgi:hypothetical protein
MLPDREANAMPGCDRAPGIASKLGMLPFLTVLLFLYLGVAWAFVPAKAAIRPESAEG